MKLWLLLVRRAAVRWCELHASLGEDGNGGVNAVIQDKEMQATKMVWNELWPPFESVMSAFETNALTGILSVRTSDYLPEVASPRLTSETYI